MKSSRKIQEIVANRILLKSPEGKLGASFEAHSGGCVSLNLHGPEGSTLMFTIDIDGNPKITFMNKESRPAISLGISDDLGHGISVMDREGRPVCYIAVPPDGVPRIMLYEAVSPREGRKFWETPRPEAKPKQSKRPARTKKKKPR